MFWYTTLKVIKENLMGPQGNDPDANKPNVGAEPDTGVKPPENSPASPPSTPGSSPNPLAPTSEPTPPLGPASPAGPVSSGSPSPLGGIDKPAAPGTADPQKNMKIVGIVAGGLVLLAILIWVVLQSF